MPENYVLKTLIKNMFAGIRDRTYTDPLPPSRNPPPDTDIHNITEGVIYR